MEIRYTTDGNEPVATSSLYTDSLVVTNDITINAATFTNGKQMGKNLTLPLHWNKATARPVQDGNNQTYRLTNGLRGSNKQSDFEWCGWYDEDATFTIDLGKTEAINEITIGCITNYGMGAPYPQPDYVVRLRRQPDIYAGCRTQFYSGRNIPRRYPHRRQDIRQSESSRPLPESRPEESRQMPGRSYTSRTRHLDVYR